IKDNINGKLKDLKDEIQKKDVQAIKEKMDILTKEIQKIGEYMYKNVKADEQQSQQQGETSAGPNPGETEIHEDKENKGQ
ncbi:MAG: hypothetical protein M1386_06770, partial [Candidatus Thermoplasmatota archaeon]|nr:hypothetical protein [Candidatus Thermoplasmatota archaeon]